jgi:hypothetical protein
MADTGCAVDRLYGHVENEGGEGSKRSAQPVDESSAAAGQGGTLLQSNVVSCSHSSSVSMYSLLYMCIA